MDEPGVREVECENWADFRAALHRYCHLKRGRRDELWFRGHGSADHRLLTTLDRLGPFECEEERQRVIKDLREEFRREAIQLQAAEKMLENDECIELLARHYGLPSPLLDWTQSPFVASYFALTGAEGDTPVAIWVLDTSRIKVPPGEIQLLQDDAKIRWNERALRQRGVFLRVSIAQRPLEETLRTALTKFVLPADRNDYRAALDELDEMMVNGTSLFYDCFGAARTATLRIMR